MDSMFHGSIVTANRVIYTPSPFARANLLHVQEVGMLHAQQPHTSSRRNMSSYLFFVVESGSGELEYDGTIYRLSPGDCVFIDCRKQYSHTTSQDLWQLRWVHFYGPNMAAIYEKYVERGGKPCLHPPRAEEFSRILREIFALASSDDHVRDMRLCERLISLLTQLMKESWHPENVSSGLSGRRSMQDVKEYLDAHFRDRNELDMLAESFYINKFYLTRLFREQFGVSINSYLWQVRTTHAKQLLRFSDMTVEAIALDCGVGDANYFSRMFRRVEGVSPGEYRAMW